MGCRFASAERGKREGRAPRRESGGGLGGKAGTACVDQTRRETAVGRQPGNGNEALLEGKSRRAGRMRNVRRFPEEVLEFPAVGKAFFLHSWSSLNSAKRRCYQRRAFASLENGVGRGGRGAKAFNFPRTND